MGERAAAAVKVGVMVPTFNRPDLLRCCVLQLAAQSRPPDLICVQQNGHPDSYIWAVEDLRDAVFSVSRRCGLLFTRGAEFRHAPLVEFTSHAQRGAPCHHAQVPVPALGAAHGDLPRARRVADLAPVAGRDVRLKRRRPAYGVGAGRPAPPDLSCAFSSAQ